jgi:hypothetical protein
MGYYHIVLSPHARHLCTIVLPFGKYKYQQLPMELCNSPDVFQEKMSELMAGFKFVQAYIYDLLVIIKGAYHKHQDKLDIVLT